MNSTSRTPSGDKRARTRDQLLAAAQELLLTQSAGSLGIRQITSRIGMVHGTFYNYYPDIDALLDDLAALIFAAHAALVARLRAGAADDPAATFALVTRLTLRQAPGYGRLMFDAGLPIDRFITGLRLAMRADVAEGVARGQFTAPDVEIAVSMVCGGMIGFALDLHRNRLPVSAIEPLTETLMLALGAAADTARRLAFAPAEFPPPPSLPLQWRGIALPAQEPHHAG